jgi:hypothetical protein
MYLTLAAIARPLVRRAIMLAGAALLAVTWGALAQTGTAEKPYVVEYYYKAKWGSAEEFIRLFRKNHFPVLRRLTELGRILKVSAVRPRLHGTEDGRWDYRVTIVWKNVRVTDDGFDEEALAKELYPDQETFKREEQRRFDVLLAHWDLPIADVDLDK